MAALCLSSLSSHLFRLPKSQFYKPTFNFTCSHTPTASFSQSHTHSSKPKLISAISSPVSVETQNPPITGLKIQNPDEKFDWFAQWYPVMPVCDLDKRVPTAKRVMGLDIVVWWDRNENSWKVLDDCCPHRLAPLSEGRIDQWGRLQCVYHGWCFNGSGDCKFIPQASRDGPPVWTAKKACVAGYPSTVQNDIVWFWPNTDPQFKDIIMTRKPPYFPELDDPSYTKTMGNRDIHCGYEIMMENVMDPAHAPYLHYGIMGGARMEQKGVKADREGGRPIEMMSVQKQGINGFAAKLEWGSGKFLPPCLLYTSTDPWGDQGSGTEEASASMKQRRALEIVLCVPVSPGKCRVIWVLPRNFNTWIHKIVPRWIFHVAENLIFDSDLCILHSEERKLMEIGPSNWRKACFTPTKSDALVVGFRKWLNTYAGGQIDWGTKFNGGALPPSPPREQIMDRHRSHVVNCSSCRSAHKGLRALEVSLQIVSIAMIGGVAATKQGMASKPGIATLVSIAVLCYAASRWLAHFIDKNFHFHDYKHGLR